MWPTSVCQLLPRNSSVVLFSIQCNFCSPSTSSPRIAAVAFCVFTQLRWLFWSVICAVENPVTFELAHFNTVIFPMTVTKKIWQGATSRRKGLLGLVIWANRIGVTSAGKSQEHEANDCAESAVGKLVLIWLHSGSLSFSHGWTPAHRMSLPAFTLGLPSLIKPLWKHPDRHTQRCSLLTPWAFLNAFKRTAKIPSPTTGILNA